CRRITQSARRDRAPCVRSLGASRTGISLGMTNDLLDQSNRDWITIKFAFARLNRGHDHEDEIQQMQDREKEKPDQNQTKNSGNQSVDQHRDLKIERFLAMRVDLRRILTLGQPNNERTKNVSNTRNEKSS